MRSFRSVFALAISATATALSLSVLAGWQRGGTWPERLIWIAIGVVLVTSAHLLPALIRGKPPLVLAIGSMLWLACMATACYGHVTFFLLAQQHAGVGRVAAAVTAPPSPLRPMTVVMADRASITQQLAMIDARRCHHDCRAQEARRVTLVAKLDALNAEVDEMRRVEAERDRVASQHDALLVDPVTSRLAALLNTTTARVDLLSGLTFAIVLESVGCLLWAIALGRPSFDEPARDATPLHIPTVAVATSTVSPVTTGDTMMAPGKTVSCMFDDPNTPSAVMAQPDDVITRLAHDVAAGLVRPTVADIRIHLGCSQAKALALRRRLAELNLAA
ncbi:hypothetical protein [Burkholderia multivorans]|uniref:hypothetical protein n=1 Tax=Burkholderia multivorans TaxID=87883 RepID=UPI000751F1A3|nr:hypothetical protein [Burkholderia multivorans]KWH22716.1 hypothetical protein WL98_16375 [Burkholderia multivorans]MBU9444265.1 hypothetical protein [Burkholderia multivorans]MBU9610404.1 hypothetical protein [Burkholderia multivorans]MDI3303654.1 hypothetical protein [Burkholderia multivorans]